MITEGRAALRAQKGRHTQSTPGRIAFVNGRYIPHTSAAVHIEDRGLQFGDSIYEVYAVSNGKLLDEAGHIERLGRSLTALEMAWPASPTALKIIMRELVRRNRLSEGLVYLQVTRGPHHRDHAIPKSAHPTLIMTASRLDIAVIEARREAGIAVVTEPDIRWGRCDIKTTNLLPNVLAKTRARRAGAFEVWFHDKNDMILEGSSTNAWIVTGDSVVVTRALEANILAGVTRATLMQAATDAGIRIEERGFSVAEAWGAKEAFQTSATGGVMPVVSIDRNRLGEGKPGKTTVRMHELYRTLSRNRAKP